MRKYPAAIVDIAPQARHIVAAGRKFVGYGVADETIRAEQKNAHNAAKSIEQAGDRGFVGNAADGLGE